MVNYYLRRQDESNDGHEEAGELLPVEDEVEDLLEGRDLGLRVALLEFGLQGGLIWGLAGQIRGQLHQGVTG